MEHNFFEPQPVKDADVYLMRMILHDWPDEKAVAILKHLAEAKKDGGRIVIMDMVLPVPGTGSPTLEAALRQKDLTMRQVLQAHEREVEDWHSLVSKADARLRIIAIRQPEGSQYVFSEGLCGHEAADPDSGIPSLKSRSMNFWGREMGVFGRYKYHEDRMQAEKNEGSWRQNAVSNRKYLSGRDWAADHHLPEMQFPMSHDLIIVYSTTLPSTT